MPDLQERPLKMISHNVLRRADEGGETAFLKAKEMGISIVRYDFRWRQLATPGGWLWDDAGRNHWNDTLVPTLKWTKEHGMRTMVNLLAFKVPSHTLARMNEEWRAAGGRGRLEERKGALWAAWAAEHGIDLPSPKEFTETLLDRLAEGQERGDWDIAAFCVLNEPNTKWPAEPNWKSLSIPGGPGGTTYTTASLCLDMCRWVKAYIDEHHRDTLGHTVNVVNLYSYRGHWEDEDWRRVAEDPSVDVLGIDIYWDQLFGIFARGRPAEMREISQRHGKPWWLVETAGADNPGWLWRNPSCRRIRDYTDECKANGSEVLGYYRLWGDYSWPWKLGAGYNVYIDPGDMPRSRIDGDGKHYWELIRDL